MKLLGMINFLLLFSCAQAARWSPDTYPNPLKDVKSCGRRGVTSWVCDPDGIIAYDSANVVEGILKKIYNGEPPYALGPCGSYGMQGYQVAVALMRGMVFTGDAGVAAGKFARRLHDLWGVGDARCNNGVLLLVSIKDRQIYISTGSGTSSRLAYNVIDDIIADVRPFLKNQRFNEAVERAVVDIGLALAGSAVEPKGDRSSVWQELVGLGIFGSVVGLIIFFSARVESRQRRRYQDCKSKLDKLKRDQTAMRASTYNPTSCPVCLEDFVTEVPAAATPRDDSDATTGSGGVVQPGGCLSRGGADGDEASKGVSLGSVTDGGSPRPAPKEQRWPRKDQESSGDDDVRKPLLEQERNEGGAAVAAGYPGGDSPTAPALAGCPQASAAAPGATSPQQQQRRPLVLPCGHAFCEQCITQWLDQKKVTCPICRKPFDEDDTPPAIDPRDSTVPRLPRPDNGHNNNQSNNNRPGLSSGSSGGGPSTSRGSGSRPPCSAADDDDYIHPGCGAASSGISFGGGSSAPRLRLRWGNRRRPLHMQEDMLLAEMMFRLRQLQRQHPDYISTSMFHSWEHDLQNGREFNAQQLRQFQLNDPSTRRELARSGRSGSSGNFGGGSSSGGHGGSW